MKMRTALRLAEAHQYNLREEATQDWHGVTRVLAGTSAGKVDFTFC